MSIFRRLRQLFPTGPSPAKPVRVVTDSTADLPAELAAELAITVVPLQVIFGEETFRDGVDLTSEEFFRRLQEATELPSTSQPSVGDFQQVYEGLAETTDHIISIHMSSRLSGTVEAARQAARACADRCQVEVIDSATVSMAMGFAVIAAARAAREGADLAACTQTARSVLGRQHIAVALDTLEYLRRGGRIGRAQAFVGGILRLKPILTLRDGEAYPLARVRTHRKAMEEILRISLDHGQLEEAAVMHANAPEDARTLADELSRRCPGVPVHTRSLGPVLGVYGGPGLVGIAIVVKEAVSVHEPEAGPAPVIEEGQP